MKPSAPKSFLNYGLPGREALFWLSACLLVCGGMLVSPTELAIAQVQNAVAVQAQPTISPFFLGGVYQYPDKQATPPLNKPQHGFNITLDTRWNDHAGYHPIRLKFQRTAPSQQDNKIKVEFFHATSYRSFGGPKRDPGYTVVQEIDVPASAPEVEAIVQVPYISQNNGGTSWEVYVDGKLAEELSAGYPNIGYLQESFGVPRFLFVEDQGTFEVARNLLWSVNPELSEEELERLLRQGRVQYWGRSNVLEFSFLELPLEAFPDQAQGYSNLDILYVTHPQFQALRKEEKIWRAVQDWIAAGGNIWIMGVDLDGGLTALDQDLGFSHADEESSDSSWQSWQEMQEDQINQNTAELIVGAEEIRRQNNPSPNASSQQSTTQPAPAIPEMRIRSLMMGRIVVFAEEQPFGPQENLIGKNYLAVRFPYSSLLEKRDSWQHRHGLSLQGENTGFWNWLVPGVGLPPVSLFQVLITLFVIGIGPVNYILLRRVGRLNLLLATVPLAALSITACIFAYSLLTDGLSTRVRTRSYTEIDQSTGLAVSWARHSYYSGLRPQQGLTFPRDTIVYPIHPEDYNYSHNNYDNSFYEFHLDEEQRLLGDWLPSRVPTQYLAILSTETTARLQVKQEQAKLQIHNELQTSLRQLLVNGTNGKFYWGENIAEGDDLELTEISPAEAKNSLRATLQEQKLEFPDELQGMNHFPHYPYGRSRSSIGLHGVYVSTESSLLELSLEEIEQGQDSRPTSPFAPGRFIAITNGSPLVTSGLQEVLEKGSLHVITGRWK